MAVFGITWLLLLAVIWFSIGFLRANYSLKRGDLDAVTSNEPPEGLWSRLAGPTVRLAEPSGITAARWTARILGTLLLAIYGLFVVAEGLPPIGSQPEGVQLSFVAMGLMLLGFVVGWKREGTAALLIASGWTVWHIAEGRISLNAFQTPLPVAVLYGLCWWATHGRRTRVVVVAVAVLAVALGLGQLFCPSSVFVRGVVADAQSGKPIANAEVTLESRSGRSRGEKARPNARSRKDGRYDLYVGWYAEQKRVSITAPGYATLTTNLGPRALGQRNVGRDYQLRPAAASSEQVFGPVIERVLYDPDDRPREETLSLATGTLSSELVGAEKLGGGRIRRLVASPGDLYAEFDDYVGGRWGLITAGLRLSDLSPQQWETATVSEVQKAVELPTVVPHVTQYGAILYLLPEGLSPMTFAFRTRQGDIGVLQVTGFTDNPRGVKIHYKLLEGHGPAIFPAGQTLRSPEFGPVMERELGGWPTWDCTVLDLDQGRVLVVPTNIVAASMNNPRPMLNWMMEHGADLTVTMGAGAGLHLDDGVLLRLVAKGATFESVVASTVRRHLGRGGGLQDVVVTKAELEAQPVFLYKTGEGGVGVLQVLGVSQDPHNLRIRFKAVLRSAE
jgi:hypothetical protein